MIACKSKQPLAKTERIIETEIVRDTVLNIKADSSLIRALLECDSLGRIRIKELKDIQSGENVKPPAIAIDNSNVLTAKCEVDSFSIYLAWKEKYTSKESETPVIVETEKKLSKWQYFFMVMGEIFCGLIGALLIIFGIKKLIFKKQ